MWTNKTKGDDGLLEVTNLSKRYGQKQAIDGISFSIRQGEAVGFLGVNGAGKSTTMNILTGYLSASDGEVVIDGLVENLLSITRIEDGRMNLQISP